MLNIPKTDQIQPNLPLQEAPVHLPEEFPVNCSKVYTQSDKPITHLHRHDVPEIGYCHSGSGIWIVGSKIFTFGPGDVIFITEHEAHLARSASGTTSEWTWLYCDPLHLFLPGVARQPLPDLSTLHGESFVNIFPRSRYPLINSLVLSIIDELRGRQIGRRQVVTGLFFALLSAIERHAPAQRTAAPRTRNAELARLAPALTHILMHYAEEIDVDRLAHECSMSVTNFRRVFGRELGKAPRDYLTGVRLAMAAAELDAGTRKINDIAQRCGFPTLSAFNRLFLRANGVTPRQWRSRGMSYTQKSARKSGARRPADQTGPT